jgi:hypothetical protein
MEIVLYIELKYHYNCHVMNKTTRNRLGLCASGILACLSGTAGAASIFTEDFSSYAGTQNNTQYETGLEVAYGGNVTGWTKSAGLHAVDLANLGGESNPSDWAIMFYQSDGITLDTGIAANDLSTSYEVTFDYGTAVYGAADAGPQQRTLAGDGLLVEVLRGDNTVLASQSFTPGAWDDASNQNLDGGLTGTLAYVGDGTGIVRLRIGQAASTSRFTGEIDNISVASVPEPTTTALLGLGGLALILRRRK